MPVQTLDIISVNVWNIIISLANLVIIFLIMKKLLFGPVKKVLEDRKKVIDGIYSEAEDVKNKAYADKALYEERISHAEGDAQKIVDDAREKAKEVGDGIIADANKRASDTIRRADENIELEKRRAVNEMKDSISELSCDIAEKVIGREIDEKDHKELIDGFISGLEG